MRFSYSQDSARIRQIKRFRGTVGLGWVDLQRRTLSPVAALVKSQCVTRVMSDQASRAVRFSSVYP
jgi:hypothetical protein